MVVDLMRRTVLAQTGSFLIKTDGFVVINIDPESSRIVSEQLDFLNGLGEIRMTPASMLEDLERRKVKVEDKLRTLIYSGFFYEGFYQAKSQLSDQLIIVRGYAAPDRQPGVIIEHGLPQGVHLIDPKATFLLTYLLTRFMTSDVLSVLSMYKLQIMSKPIYVDCGENSQVPAERFILSWSPRYNIIGLASYDSDSGDNDTGYVFNH